MTLTLISELDMRTLPKFLSSAYVTMKQKADIYNSFQAIVRTHRQTHTPTPLYRMHHNACHFIIIYVFVITVRV